MTQQHLKPRVLARHFRSFRLIPYVSRPSAAYKRTSGRFWLAFFTCLLLLSEVMGEGSLLPGPALAASLGKLPSAPSKMTFQQFLKQGQRAKVYHGPLIHAGNIPSRPQPQHTTDYTHLPASAEVATMKVLSQSLAPAFLNGSVGTKELDLVGSDGRLEVIIQPGSLDLSRATVAGGGQPSGALTLRMTQIHGHYISLMNELGSYQLQVIDSHGQVVHGITLHHPLTIVYHYQLSEMNDLNIDPGHVLLSWPTLIANAMQARTSTAGLTIPMQDDVVARTLTAQSQALGVNPFDLSSEPANQSPPSLHLASMQGNNGQLTYSYPLQVAPGAGGFAPQLSLNYSSAGPNERHSSTSPASDIGDGWSLSLGSISEETYAPSNTKWYFLNDVAGVGDRLIPTGSNNLFDTEHISYLRIQQINPGANNTCFHAWDTSGTYYELGCTADSLQFWTDSSGVQHDYRWDVSKIIAPNEGANAGAYRMILATYVQDKTTFNSNGHNYTNIRDASLKQVIYGSGNANSVTSVAGTVDFLYHGPNKITSTSGDSSRQVTWVAAYGNNYNCTSAPPITTTLRCDDPVADGSVPAPTVMSTLTLDTVATYVGNDTNFEDYSYAFSYSYNQFKDNPFSGCNDSYTLVPEYCAGEHLLMAVTPTVYQNNSGHLLKGVTFGYGSPLQNTYYDSLNKTQNGSQQYGGQTFWQYMNFYEDLNTGVGGHITWARAYNNTHGTPTVKNGNVVTDDRYDALYCTTHANDQDQTLHCTGVYAHPDDHAWSEQVVTQIKTLGTDSSSGSLQPATTTFGYYRLAKTGVWDGKGTWCEPDQYSQNKDCVGDNWIPSGDNDWRDYLHAEYQGFAQVWTTSPANDLTVDYYDSTEGWNTPKSDYQNFEGGFRFQEDIYSGNSYTPSALLRTITTTYADSSNACRSTTQTYPACEIVILKSRTTDYPATSSPPFIEHDYSYDDYSVEFGLQTGGYHNTTQDSVWGSNFASFTKNWTYSPNNQSVGQWTYYTVDKATQSKIVDSTSHTWQCQSISYDENAPSNPPKPAAGWPTTIQTYSSSNCATLTNPLTTTYTGYDQLGNQVASVDGVAAANSALYGSNGCTATPSIYSSNWGKTRYTTCTAYDSYNAQPQTMTNAFSQNTGKGYDPQQGSTLTSTTDLNSKTTSYTYSYDSNGNKTVQVALPLASGSYTSRSSTNSSCTNTSTLPCFEIDNNSYLYNTVKSSTFYDDAGRAVETRNPGPGSGYDTIVITTYNDQAHTVWKSVPFEVTHGSGWLDPNGATDYNGVTPGGTVTYYDALNRSIAVQDPLIGQGQDGITCSATLSGSFTSCTNYGVGQVSGDPNVYVTATDVDANGHVTITSTDGLGRKVYVQSESGKNGGSLSANELVTYQYNALDQPTSVTTKDLAPQAGQSTTSVTVTASYDDLGRMTNLNDPDRGAHTYTYDGNGKMLTDVAGTRTLGYSYDLLGRLGCEQNQAPIQTANGACSGGATAYIQNTYDTTVLGTQGSTDFPIGQLTRSITTTIYPDSSSATATELMQHDQRGRLITKQMQFGLPGGWNVTTALPTYQMQYSYNDADQQVTTTTSTIPTGQGYTSTQLYDSVTGTLTGLSNGSANLATLTYNARAQLDTINFLTGSGSALLGDQYGYDANLRPNTTTATWQGGSGNSGTVLSQSRSYDPTNNVISLSTTLAAVPGANGSGGSETQNFCYDEQNRLVWAGNSGAQPPPGNGVCGSGTLSSGLSGGSYSNVYIYTHLGQLWQGPLAGGSTQYQYLYCNSQPHQLTGLYPTGTSCSNLSGAVYTSSYDNWGNVTSRFFSGTTGALSYDALDRFVEWNAGSNNQEWYVYDASGNRVLRRSTNGSGTSLVVYAFGMEEHNYSASGTNQWNTYYYTLANHLIGSLDGNGVAFYITDALGSVLTSFNNAPGGASVKGNQVFGPYGKGRYYQGNINTAKGFTGQYNDGLTGLDYYNARYYDPVVGVFLSADTVQGNMQALSPYMYVGGNPETLNDPTGQCPWCFLTTIVGGAIGLGVGLVTQIQHHDFTPGAFLRTAADAGIGAADGFLIGTGVGAPTAIASLIGTSAATGTIIGGTIGVISQVWGTGTLQDTFESAGLGGITNALAAGLIGATPRLGSTVLNLFDRWAPNTTSQFLKRMLLQSAIQSTVSASGNAIQQGIDNLTGEQKGWSWGSFTESVVSSAVAAVVAQGVSDTFASEPVRTTNMSRFERTQAVNDKWDSIYNLGSIITGVSQGAGQYQFTIGNRRMY